MGTPELPLPKLLCMVQEDELKAAWRDWSQGWSSTLRGFGTVVEPGAQQASEDVAEIQARSLVFFPACSEVLQEKGMAWRGGSQCCSRCQAGRCPQLSLSWGYKSASQGRVLFQHRPSRSSSSTSQGLQ